MSTVIHDPYLNSVKRALEDKKYKELYKKEKAQGKIKSFIKQEFEITDYIHLPKTLANTVFVLLFFIVPYIVGLGFIFFVVAKANISTFLGINIKEYPVYWAIGYEVIASLLLFIIIKSAISYKNH